MLPAFWLERGSCPAALHERGLCSGRGIFLYGRPPGYGGEVSGERSTGRDKQHDRQPGENATGGTVQEQLPLDGTVETPGDPSRKQ